MGRAVPFHVSVHDSGWRVVLEKEERTRMKLLSLAAAFIFLPVSILADSSALIVRGVAGSPEHETKFDKWTEGTQKALVEKFGFSSDRVIVLSDKKSVQAEIQKAFATLKQQLKPGDTFFLFF